LYKNWAKSAIIQIHTFSASLNDEQSVVTKDSSAALIHGMVDQHFLLADSLKQDWELELAKARLIAEGKDYHEQYDLLCGIEKVETAREHMYKQADKIGHLEQVNEKVRIAIGDMLKLAIN